MLLSEFRAQYPQYGDLSDEDLARGLHEKHYSDIPYPEFAASIGLEQPKQSVARRVGDFGLSLAKGVIAVPEAAVGLADIVTGGGAGKLAEEMGYRPKAAKAFIDEYESDAQKAANKKVADADGFVDTAVEMLKNPSTIAHAGVESVPAMGGGAVVGRGLLAIAPKVAPFIAGAVGEGAVGAGQAAEQTRQANPSGDLSPLQSAAAVASGIGTTIFGAVGGRIAQKFGVPDVDTMLVKVGSKLDSQAIGKRILAGGISEGLFEEMPQSMQEQIWQNVAMGKPLMEGVDKAAAQGLIVGAAMGGTVAGAAPYVTRDTAPPGSTPPPPAPPVAPPAPPVDPIKAIFEAETVEQAVEAAERAIHAPVMPETRIHPEAPPIVPLATQQELAETAEALDLPDAQPLAPEAPAGLLASSSAPLAPVSPEVPDARAVEDPPVTPAAGTTGAAPAGAAAPGGVSPSTAEADQGQPRSAKEVALEEAARAAAAIREAGPEQTKALTPAVDAARIAAEAAGASPAEIIDAMSGRRTPNIEPVRAPESPADRDDVEYFARRRDGQVPTFTSAKAANLYKKQTTNRVPGNYKAEEEGGKWYLVRRKRARTEKQKLNDERLRTAAKKSRQIAQTDSARVAIGKAGSLRMSDLLKDGEDEKSLESFTKGFHPMVRKNGKLSIDGAAEILHSAGFDVLDEYGNIDATKAREIINQELHGESAYTHEGAMQLEALDAEARAKAEADGKVGDETGLDEEAIDASGYNDLSDEERYTVEIGIQQFGEELAGIPEDVTEQEAISDEERAKWEAEAAWASDGSGEAPRADRAEPPTEGAQGNEEPRALDEGSPASVESPPAQSPGGSATQNEQTAPSGAVSASEDGEGVDVSREAARAALVRGIRAHANNSDTPENMRGGWSTGDSPFSFDVGISSAKAGTATAKFWNFEKNKSDQHAFSKTELEDAWAEAKASPEPTDTDSSEATSGITGGEVLADLTPEQVSDAWTPYKTLFADPDKKVRLADKVKQYVANHGWMKPKAAELKIAEWKKRAKAQMKSHGSENAGKVVLSLFDYTGAWAKPWAEAGYTVYTFDIQNGEEEDIRKFGVDYFIEKYGEVFEDVHAILAAVPCTDFAVSGARHFAAKDADGRTKASIELVEWTLATIEYFKPAVWAVENPVGRIEDLGGLPPWRLSFDPNHLGHPYTKKTLLWGRFNADLPIAPVEPTEGSKMWAKFGGKSQATKNARSETPEGFSYAFFMANNAVDNRAMAIANTYDRLDPKLIEKAVAAGATEEDIKAAVDDHYYMDLDDDAANAALKKLASPKSAEEAAPPLELKGETEAEIQQREASEAAAKKKQDDEDRAIAEQEREARVAAELKGRQSVAADSFSLEPTGAVDKKAQKAADAKAALDQFAGQEGLFGGSTRTEEAKPEASIADIPPGLLKKIKVQVQQHHEGEGVKTVEVTAAEALADSDAEISAYEKLLDCVRAA